jgi:hypothetical protein
MTFLENQEIYVVAKYLADLKYFGAPMKQVKGAYAVGVVTLHPRWAELFRAFRKHLGSSSRLEDRHPPPLR